MSTVQIRVIGNENKETIAIHQEKLLNSEQRNEIKEYWTEIIEKITNKIEYPAGNNVYKSLGNRWLI